MEIAELAVQVQPMFFSTKEYCREYLTEKAPELFITVTPEELVFEQKMLDQEAEEEGLRHRKFTDPFLERTAIQRKVADRLVSRNTLLLHGSTVAVDGRAYLFTAPCGTGKSTHTRLWREVFGNRAVMVNDDKPFLQLTESGILAYGSPWSGKHGLATNIFVPLTGICYLSRGESNRIEPARDCELLDFLRHETHIPENPVLAEKALNLVDALAHRVPLWRMSCNKHPDAARMSYEVMCGKYKNL